MAAACPLPVYDVDPGLNQPIAVRDDLVAPAEGFVTAVKTCPGQRLQFRLEPALSDPDGDRLYAFWFINYTPGDGGQPDAILTFDFDLDPCLEPKALTDDTLQVEAVVTDRLPDELDAEGARTPQPDADQVILRWFVEVEEESACCP